ncbi:hypothetical protein INR49_000344 [Caranx melampygus]|nr:hypothetical protein INR49_000344 [Caranx melampygus]
MRDSFNTSMSEPPPPAQAWCSALRIPQLRAITQAGGREADNKAIRRISSRIEPSVTSPLRTDMGGSTGRAVNGPLALGMQQHAGLLDSTGKLHRHSELPQVSAAL